MSQVRLERYRIDNIIKFEKETEEEVISGARVHGFRGSPCPFKCNWKIRIARGDGLRWWSVGFGFVEYRGINILLQRKNSNRDLEEGRDRRRLKLSTLTDYGKEQDMEIEALEAMLMDDEFRGSPPFLIFSNFESCMDGYTLHPPAQDLAPGGYSSAAKGGVAGERSGKRIAGETRAAPLPAPTPYKDVLVGQS
ncbi:hypothetical protein NC652_029144 [Populus alba x Populus x berolinensis]|nr:hypothetical protein NC652_029144 [Populus alba x Populus x berolinensis]